MPYWRYLKAFEYAGETNWPTESDMRWNAFSGLVYGYTGHTWFVYQIRPADTLNTALFETTGEFNSPPTDRFFETAQINLEMANLGKLMTHLTSTDVRYLAAIGSLRPDETRPWKYGAGNDPYIVEIKTRGPRRFQDLLVGYFEDDRQKRHFMIQNVNHTNGEFPVWGDEDAVVEVVFDFSAADASAVDKKLMQAITPDMAGITELPLQSLEGDRRKLRVTLAAGNPILLKYKTADEPRATSARARTPP